MWAEECLESLDLPGRSVVLTCKSANTITKGGDIRNC
jgi:hypothetical protein